MIFSMTSPFLKILYKIPLPHHKANMQHGKWYDLEASIFSLKEKEPLPITSPSPPSTNSSETYRLCQVQSSPNEYLNLLH